MASKTELHFNKNQCQMRDLYVDYCCVIDTPIGWLLFLIPASHSQRTLIDTR